MNAAKAAGLAAVTLVAWLVIAGGAAGSIISFISALMFIAGSYGTQNAEPLGALLVIGGPPFSVVTGIGLLRRKRWAWFCMVGILLAALAWQASEVLFPPPTEDRTFISPSGVRTTVLGSGPMYSVPIIAVCVAMLAVLLSRRSREQFAGPATQAAGPAAGSAAGWEAAPARPSHAEVAATEQRDIARGWRVGHRGRDQMFYEERHEGAWRSIAIDGEMLTGPAHHAIYFASPESWRSYPEWARHRRDEIIARIKNEFREPDYEYAAGGTARVPVATAASTPASAQPMTGGQLRALLTSLVVLLGITAGMAWLVTTGLRKNETWWPAKRASQSRIVTRAEEPAMFWTSLGVYSGIGLGTLALSVCMIRWSREGRD